MASKFSRSQSNRASFGCAGQTSQINRGSTTNLTGLKGSVAYILVPDVTGHNGGFRGEHNINFSKYISKGATDLKFSPYNKTTNPLGNKSNHTVDVN